ncbi:MAG: penicillin-binding protein 2 [Alphaproteobacteria bacterium]|nr:penicillin-binding protein 2 [Alphaproteobacteria bacterium]
MITRDGDKGKTLTRRAAMLAGGQLFLSSVLLSRMYYLQVLEADRYKTLAEENRISTRLVAPPRGLIFDRFGQPMAQNNQNFRVLVISEQTEGNLNATLEALNKILPLTDGEIQRIRKDVRRSRDFTPVTIRENLTWEQMAAIQLNAPDLPGIIIDEGLSRFYPFKEASAHLLGYVGAVSEEEIASGNPLLKLPGFRVGKSGIELEYNTALCGKEGAQRVEVNAVGRVIREIERDEGVPGTTLPLTIDMRIQNIAYKKMKDESGAAVLLDIYTGEILALVSTPGFDPNKFNRGLTSEEWRKISTNERNALLNKALGGLYSPGSTFKMIVALAALEAGVIRPDTKVFCGGHIMMGSHRFHCWKGSGHGNVDLKEALMHSCDIYFYEVARRTGIDKIAAMAKRFGLGVSTGVNLPGEKAGLMPTRRWKEVILGEQWLQGDTYNAGIGQGYILTTPIQLAVMTAVLANDGYKIKPTILVPENRDSSVCYGENLNISKTHLQLMREGMFDVVNASEGTGKAARLNIGGKLIAGKTGTTQVKRISMKEREQGVRSQDDIPWEERNHALFVSFGPTDNPRYALAVVIEHGGGGAKTAAPIAKAIMEAVLKLDPASKPPKNPKKNTSVGSV